MRTEAEAGQEPDFFPGEYCHTPLSFQMPAPRNTGPQTWPQKPRPDSLRRRGGFPQQHPTPTLHPFSLKYNYPPAAALKVGALRPPAYKNSRPLGPGQWFSGSISQPLVKELVLSKFPLLLAKIWVTRGRAVENLINLRIYFLAKGGKKKAYLLVS